MADHPELEPRDPPPTWNCRLKRWAVDVLLSAALGAALWALSEPITGRQEPWDSPGPYYLVGLVLLGVVLGLFRPWGALLHFVGAFLGQLAWMAGVIGIGAFFLLGVVILLGASGAVALVSLATSTMAWAVAIWRRP